MVTDRRWYDMHVAGFVGKQGPDYSNYNAMLPKVGWLASSALITGIVQGSRCICFLLAAGKMLKT